MSEHTDIQWTDSTVNPVMGCQTCELWSKTRKTCYAGTLHQLRAGKKGYAKQFEVPEHFPGRMAKAAAWSDLAGRRRIGKHPKPWLEGSPRLIFVSDMGDAFSATVPFHYLLPEVIEKVATPQGRRHRFLWLTKQPARAAEFSRWLAGLGISWPSNLWIGTSITTQRKVDRVRHLLEVGDSRTLRFLSVEPQWEQLDLSACLPKVDWCIQGGESGKIAKPFHMAWARELKAQCREARTPFFLKQLGARVLDEGERIKLRDKHGGSWSEWPAELRVREVPTVRTSTSRWRKAISMKAAT